MEHLITALHNLTHELRKDREARQSENSFRCHADLATKHDIEQMEKRILMTQKELETALNSQTTQIGKIAKEQSDRFDVLTKTIADLNAVIQAGGDVTSEVTTALANTQSALDSLDAAIPDAPVS